jgi:phasin family protein
MTNPTDPFQEFMKSFEKLSVPGLDVTKLLESQRKDIEALTEANRLAYTGMQTVAQKQTEILRRTLEEVQAAARETMAGGDASTLASKQAQLAQRSLQRTIEDMREIAELNLKVQTEAFDVVNKRFQENLAGMLKMFQPK